MPKATYTRILDHNGDAGFQQWGRDLSAALKSVLTQTADTGQIDWPTATPARPANNNYTYYEIYRFNDALQASRPVFLKVEYGTASTANFPGFRISLGSATNGAGVLSGVLYQTPVTVNAQAPSVNPVTTWVCAKDGYFGMILWAHPTSQTFLPHLCFLVDRSRDPSGSPTNNGLYFQWHIAASGPAAGNSYSFDVAGVIGLHGNTSNCLVPAASISSTSMAAKAKLFPHRFFAPDEYGVTGLLTYLQGEINAYTEFDAAPLPGMATQRYLAVGQMWNGSVTTQSGVWAAAMRYET